MNWRTAQAVESEDAESAELRALVLGACTAACELRGMAAGLLPAVVPHAAGGVAKSLNRIARGEPRDEVARALRSANMR